MMDTLRVYQQKSSEFNGLEEKIKSQIGAAYNGVSTNFEDLIAEFETLTKIHSTDVDFATLMTLSNQEFVAKQKDFAILSDCFAKAFSKLEEAEKRVPYIATHKDDCSKQIFREAHLISVNTLQSAC